MSRKEVEYSFAIGGALSSSFKAAINGAKSDFGGLAKRIQELENTDINKIGSQFVKQKEHIRNLGAELSKAKGRLLLLQNQSKEAGKNTKMFDLQVQEAEKDVSRLSEALNRNVVSYKRNIAQIQNTQGSVSGLAARYAKLSLEMEKTNALQNKYRALQERRENLRTARSSIQAEMVQTAVPAFALSLPIQQAIQFESSMADVAKTMDGMRDDNGNLTAQYYAMEQAVKDMAREIPVSHNEIAGLFAAAGQQGLTDLSEIQEFTKMSAQMAVAFGMSNEQAADAIGGYRSAMGLSFEETRSMLDLMNQYANTSSATEEDIANVVRRIGGLGGVAGMAAKPMTALSATLVSMKVPPEQAATGIKNLLLALTAGKAATKNQSIAFKKLGFDTVKLSKAMQKDAPNAILKVLNALKKLPEYERLSTMQEIFGKESLGPIAPMLKQLDLVTKNLEICADETQFAGAMAKEASARWNSTAGQLQRFKNASNEVAINIGSALLPAINDTIGAVSPLVNRFADYAKENPEVIKYTVGTAGALLGVKMACLVTMYAVNGLRSVYTRAKTASLAFSLVTNRQTLAMSAHKAVMLASAAATKTVSAVTKAATAAQWLLNAAFAANPIGFIVTALGMAGAAMYALYQTCEPVRNAFDWAFSGIAGFIQNAWDMLKGLWGAARSVAEALGLIDDVDVEIDEKKTSVLETPASPAVRAAANPMPNFMPASIASEEFINTANNQQNIMQNTQISIPMNFDVQGLDEREFRRQMENARPDFEEIVKRIVEKISHEKARISFAN